MKTWNIVLAAVLAAIVSLLTANGGLRAQADVASWKDGDDYDTLASAQTVRPSARGAIEVVEAFSYTCGGCYLFEPHIAAWLRQKPRDVTFIRVHTVWSSTHLAHARLYYTLQILGRDDLDQAAFDTLHRYGIPLAGKNDEETLRLQLTFAELHGISRTAFERTWRSQEIEARVRSAAEIYKRFRVMHTPAIIVNGRYVTDAHRLAGAGKISDEATRERAYRRLLEFIDEFVAQERGTLQHERNPVLGASQGR